MLVLVQCTRCSRSRILPAAIGATCLAQGATPRSRCNRFLQKAFWLSASLQVFKKKLLYFVFQKPVCLEFSKAQKPEPVYKALLI